MSLILVVRRGERMQMINCLGPWTQSTLKEKDDCPGWILRSVI
jgi:hypothetical protein